MHVQQDGVTDGLSYSCFFFALVCECFPCARWYLVFDLMFVKCKTPRNATQMQEASQTVVQAKRTRSSTPNSPMLPYRATAALNHIKASCLQGHIYVVKSQCSAMHSEAHILQGFLAVIVAGVEMTLNETCAANEPWGPSQHTSSKGLAVRAR